MRRLVEIAAFVPVVVAAAASLGGSERTDDGGIEEGDLFVYDPPQSEDPMEPAKGKDARGGWADHRGSVVAASWHPVVVDAGSSEPAVSALESMPFVRSKWPPPSADEFDAAPEVTLARNQVLQGDFGDSGSCTASAARGWLRIVCKMFEPSVSVLGGSTNGVLLETTSADATITLPLAPGDRRILQVSRVGQGYESGGLVTAGILSESWIGTDGPHVVFLQQLF
jgi:hypothetical protein